MNRSISTRLSCLQIVVGVLFSVSILQADQVQSSKTEEHQSPVPLKITRMYADETGETHFETIDNTLVAGAGVVKGLPATGVVRFNLYPATLKGDFHTCGCRMYLVVLRGGGLEIEVTDGSKVQLRPGDIMYFDDVKKQSKGQKGRALGGETLVMYIAVNPGD